MKDPNGNAVIEILGVAQDEPVNGLGDGDTSPDAVIQGDTVLLRAERWGNGNGRVYTITFTASDPEGNCTRTLKVSVPRSKKTDACSDEGALFDSTGP